MTQSISIPKFGHTLDEIRNGTKIVDEQNAFKNRVVKTVDVDGDTFTVTGETFIEAFHQEEERLEHINNRTYPPGHIYLPDVYENSVFHKLLGLAEEQVNKLTQEARKLNLIPELKIPELILGSSGVVLYKP